MYLICLRVLLSSFAPFKQIHLERVDTIPNQIRFPKKEVYQAKLKMSSFDRV